MSVRRYAGPRGTHWTVVLELGRDERGQRRQQRINRDPDTGQKIATKTRALAIERAELVRRARPGYVPPTATTVAAYLEHWLTETATARSEGAQYTYASIVRTRLVPRLKGRLLADLSLRDVERLYRELLADGYAPSTVARTRGLLVAALAAAVRWGILERNPAQGVPVPKRADRDDTAQRGERAIWTADEVRRFLTATQGTPWGALWRLLYDAMLRQGEARALAWSDVDWEAGTVTVRKTVARDRHGREVVAVRTKSAAGRRTLSLDAATLRALRQHERDQKARRLAAGSAWQPTGLIFDRGDGALLPARALAAHLARDIAAAGVPVITPHGIRHSSATIAVAAGVPLHAVKARLGHRNIAMTADLYAHFARDADQRVSATLAHALNA